MFRTVIAGVVFDYDSRHSSLLLSCTTRRWWFVQQGIREIYDTLLNWIKGYDNNIRIKLINNIKFVRDGEYIYIDHSKGGIMFSKQAVRENILSFLLKCLLGDGYIYSIVG